MVLPMVETMSKGGVTSFVAMVLCKDDESGIVQLSDRSCSRILVLGKLPDAASQVAVLSAVVLEVKPMVTVRLALGTQVRPFNPCTMRQMCSVTELCCGMGGMSSEWERAGFAVKVGVDKNDVWKPLFQSLHPQAKFLQADAGSSVTVHKIFDEQCEHGTIVAGIACQPYSRMGDGRGMADDRAGSLNEVLHTAWMTQAVVVVLECVPQVRCNHQFQQTLQEYCMRTGYHLTQQVVDLKKTWSARRERWFGILTAPALGPFTLADLPDDERFRTVGSVLPYIKEWEPSEDQQLRLTVMELERYYDYAVGGVNTHFLNKDTSLPTVLHSAGNQMTPCACGCRPALSLNRLHERGLVGTLVPLGTYRQRGHEQMQESRYLHPSEMLLLNGGSPTVDWQGKMRLGLAAVGQCVSPMVGLWIAVNLKNFLDQFVMSNQRADPSAVLEAFKQKLLDDRKMIWPQQSWTRSTELSEGIIGVYVEGLPPVSVAITTPCTVGQVRHAEAEFFPEVRTWNASNAEGDDLPDDHLIGPGSDLFFRASGEHPRLDLGGVEARSETDEAMSNQGQMLEQEDDFPGDPVLAHEESEDMGLVVEESTGEDEPTREAVDTQELLRKMCPHVSDVDQFRSLRNQMISQAERRHVCEGQGSLVADDEMMCFMEHIASIGHQNVQVTVIDPLLATSVIAQANYGLLEPYLAGLPTEAIVITAVLWNSHWYPMAWKYDNQSVHGSTMTSGTVPLPLEQLHRVVSGKRGQHGQPLHRVEPPVPVAAYCGVWAMCYLSLVVNGSPLPTTQGEITGAAEDARATFLNAMGDETSKPWVWGNGDSNARVILETTLRQHGVPVNAIADRIAFLYDKLGEQEVLKAAGASNVWRELKWLANQKSPKVQIIRPMELQQVIETRVGKGQVGNRSQKKAVKGKGKGKQGSMALDPAMLRFDSTVFQNPQGVAMPQIDLSQISSQATGVVLATPAGAAPFVSSPRGISVGSLAIVVMSSEQMLPPSPHSPVKVQFPVECKTNAEPLLVSGYMYNVGAGAISGTSPATTVAIKAVDSCVVKLMLYRDQCPVPWAQIVAQPLKVIISMLPVLQPCDTPDCTGMCECWHEGEKGDIQEPILETWGRQWLSETFQFVAAPEAAMFSVHMRIPQCLQVIIQTYSGLQGLFAEPKAVDGRQASTAFQVIWTPKADIQQLLMLKQTRSMVLGVARVGSKLGLRCHAKDAEALFQDIRPGGVYLPAGKKQLWLVGPFPYGTLRSSIAEVLKEMGWSARPLQAVGAGPSVQGMMYRVQSVEDPWAKGRAAATRELVPSGSVVGDLEQKITEAVVARLERGRDMEVDEGANSVQDRVAVLEGKMNELSVQHDTLAEMVQDTAKEARTNMDKLQTHFQSQHDMLERSLQAHAVQFRDHYRHESEKQEKMLTELFGKQREHFDAMMTQDRAVKPRHE
eukprot:Skav204952  [mRNA]  locus=scaffold3104:103375:107907:- [translate_table: standard]